MLICLALSPRPLWGEVLFLSCLECLQENSKSTGPIYMKFGGIVDIPTRANRLDFGATQLNI